jgi:hypothetical protein
MRRAQEQTQSQKRGHRSSYSDMRRGHKSS